jgi:autotransporter family porin
LIRKPWGVEIFIEQSESSINDKGKYINLLIFGLFLIGLVVIFSYGVGNVSAALGNTVYVNSAGGSDTYDGLAAVHTSGTNGPKATINNGVGTVTTNGQLKIANGIYTGTKQVFINKNMTIKGQSKTGTIIKGDGITWILFIPTSTVTAHISDLTLYNGNTSGGAIENIGTLTVNNCAFKHNNGTSGGAIFNTGIGILTVTGSTFTGNTATNGGAIYNDGGTLTVTNSNFNDNTATNGGAIYNTATLPVTVTGCTFTGNTAINNGGAINNDFGKTMTVSGSTFTDNTAAGNGGAIDNVNTMTVTGSTFTDNTATNNGGAIGSNGILNVYSSTFTGNYATFGGAIINYKTFIASGSTFTGNSATSSGGAISTSGTIPVTISSSTFSSNTATNWAGAISNSGTLTGTGCTFNGNTANSNGGAIANTGTLTVISSNLTGNNGNLGGAIYNFGTANIQFNHIVGNIAFIGNAIDNTGTIVSVSNNWWGSNNGPSTGNVFGTIVPLWLILKLSANPATIGNNGHSTITADLRYTNQNLPAGGSLPNGILVTFTTTLGTITQASTSNGIATSTLKSGTTAGTATISASLDNQKLQTIVKVKDTIPPKVSSTNPKNGATGISKTANIAIKFNENIKNSTYFNNITIKNLTTGKYVTITKSISGTTLNIKTTATRTANTWYTITIPKGAIKDYAGNNLLATYTFKFKTGA